MKISSLRKLISENGMVGTLRHIPVWLMIKREEAEIREFDGKYGTELGGTIEWSELNSAEGGSYEAGLGYRMSSPRIFKKILRSLPIDYSKYCFIDYGSGKGGILLCASEFPFKRVIGIELFRELHNIALMNIAKYNDKNQLCKEVTSLCMNAKDFDLPHEPCVCYFYNPFYPPVLDPVLSKIEQSITGSALPTWIIYQKPRFSHLFDKYKFFVEVESHDSVYEVWTWKVYRTDWRVRALEKIKLSSDKK